MPNDTDLDVALLQQFVPHPVAQQKGPAAGYGAHLRALGGRHVAPQQRLGLLYLPGVAAAARAAGQIHGRPGRGGGRGRGKGLSWLPGGGAPVRRPAPPHRPGRWGGVGLGAPAGEEPGAGGWRGRRSVPPEGLGFLLARRVHARGGRTGSAGGQGGGRRRRRRRAGAARRACLGPAARSCVQYVCLGGRQRASVRRGPRGPAQLRDCRSRSAPARLVPAGSCARPSDVNGGNGGGRRGFGLSQAEPAAGRRREGQRRGPTGGGGPRGGGCGGPAPAGPRQAPPGMWGWAGGGARDVTPSRAPAGAQAGAEPRGPSSGPDPGAVAVPAPHAPHPCAPKYANATAKVRPGANLRDQGGAGLEDQELSRLASDTHLCSSGCPSDWPGGAVRQSCFLELKMSRQLSG